MTLYAAIRTLERICLSSDSTPTTVALLRENGEGESRSYLSWLRRQCPQTSMSIPEFSRLKQPNWNKR